MQVGGYDGSKRVKLPQGHLHEFDVFIMSESSVHNVYREELAVSSGDVLVCVAKRPQSPVPM